MASTKSPSRCARATGFALFLALMAPVAHSAGISLFETPGARGTLDWDDPRNESTRAAWITAIGEEPDVFLPLDDLDALAASAGLTLLPQPFVVFTQTMMVTGSSAPQTIDTGGVDLASMSPTPGRRGDTLLDFGANGANYVGFYIYGVERTPLQYIFEYTDGSRETVKGHITGVDRFRFIGFIADETRIFQRMRVEVRNRLHYGLGNVGFGRNNIAAAPLPAAGALFLAGLGGLTLIARRRKEEMGSKGGN